MTQAALYMLDTNMASYIIKGYPESVCKKLKTIPIASICISAITEAELLRGVARKPDAKHLPLIVNEFLVRVETLSWDSYAAQTYAQLRTALEKEGKNLGGMDMLIAAHAVAQDAVLVTNDKAFLQLKDYLTLEDWTKQTK